MGVKVRRGADRDRAILETGQSGILAAEVTRRRSDLRCPQCQSSNLRVTDSRDNVESIRRRRECGECGHRFTTYERVDLFACPRCESVDARILATEQLKGGLRRRRECAECGFRYTTSERAELAKLLVIKRDGKREEFNRAKIFEGVRLACLNRPVPAERIEGLVDGVTNELVESGLSEVPARRIGDLVMEQLKVLDEVAYVRFASVYRRFEDVDSMEQIIGEVKRFREHQAMQEVQPRLIPDR